MANYTYEWKLKNEGWKEVEVETPEQAKKSNYVSTALQPAVAGTRQWDTCEYRLMRNGDYTCEYLVLSCRDGGSRWINVTGNSLGAIFEAAGENLF